MLAYGTNSKQDQSVREKKPPSFSCLQPSRWALFNTFRRFAPWAELPILKEFNQVLKNKKMYFKIVNICWRKEQLNKRRVDWRIKYMKKFDNLQDLTEWQMKWQKQNEL